MVRLLLVMKISFIHDVINRNIIDDNPNVIPFNIFFLECTKIIITFGIGIK